MIIFDLLNASHSQREYISSLIVRALEPLEQDDSVYLYLLTNNGTPYPVHPRPATTGMPAGPPWTRQIHPLLDRAVQDVFGFRLKDYADTGIRVGATFQTLADLGMQLTRITGPKTIVWITMGVPNRVAYPFGCRDVAFAGESGSYLAGKCRDGCAYLRGNQCIDYTPFLGHFSRELERTGTIFSSVEELAAGSLSLSNVAGSSEDTLRQLASLTGGHMYSSGEVEKAITQSLDGARARYQLAYHAPPANGKYHKVRVVSSRKRIRIQAQQGYYANQP